MVGTSAVAVLGWMTTSATARARAAKATASWKAVEMPWARTWWAMVAGKLTGLAELGQEVGRAVAQGLGDLAGGLVAAGGPERGDQDRQAEAADLLADVEQAGRRDLVRSHRDRHDRQGTNSRPMPRPNSSIGAEDPVDVAAGHRHLGEPAEPDRGQQGAGGHEPLGPDPWQRPGGELERSARSPAVIGRKAMPARSGL